MSPNNAAQYPQITAKLPSPAQVSDWRSEIEPQLLAHINDRMPSRAREWWSPADILQETYARAMRGSWLADCLDKHSFHSRLRNTAGKTLVDVIKFTSARKRGGPMPSLPLVRDESGTRWIIPHYDADHSPSSEVARIELKESLVHALNQLPDDQRTAFELRFVEDQKPATIAAKMGRSVSAVKSLVARAQGRLRKIMGDPSRFITGQWRDQDRSKEK